MKAKKTTYSTFYLVLLVLLTISTVLGLFNLGSIDESIALLKTQPVVAYIALSQHVVTILMAIGLIFLYKKQKRGLLFVLSGYGVAILFSLLFFFFRDPFAQDIARQVVDSGSRGVTPELAKRAADTILIAIPILNIFASGLFGTLWYFAWKKQVAYDSTDSAKSDT